MFNIGSKVCTFGILHKLLLPHTEHCYVLAEIIKCVYNLEDKIAFSTFLEGISKNSHHIAFKKFLMYLKNIFKLEPRVCLGQIFLSKIIFSSSI